MPKPIHRDEVMRRIGLLFNLAWHRRIDDQQRAFSVGALPSWVRVFFLVFLDPLSVAIAIYSFIFLKIHGQDRAVYFSAVLSADWPRGVDAQLSSPNVKPAQRLVGTARPTLTMKMEMSGHRLSVKSSRGNGL